MFKEITSTKQAVAMVTFFIMGSTLILPTGVEAGIDLWIAILVAIAGVLPLYLIFARIHTLYPERNFFSVLESVYGVFIGKLLSLVYVWFAIHLGSLVLRNFGEFIITVSMTNTPQVVILLFYIVVCIWGVKAGREVLGRWAEFFIPGTVVLTFATIILLLPVSQLANLKPILYRGWMPVLDGAFSVFSFPLAEVVIFLLVFSHFKKSKEPYLVYLLALVIGGSVIFFTSLSELSILGINLYESSYYPSNMSVARLNIGDFIQRLEIIPALIIIIGGFIKISACLLGACQGVAHVIGVKNYRFIVTPAGIFMVALAIWIYDDAIQMFQGVRYWRFYSFPFQVIIPVVTWVIAEIRTRLEGA